MTNQGPATIYRIKITSDSSTFLRVQCGNGVTIEDNLKAIRTARISLRDFLQQLKGSNAVEVYKLDALKLLKEASIRFRLRKIQTKRKEKQKEGVTRPHRS